MTNQKVYDIISSYIKDNIECDEGIGVSEIETDEGTLLLDLSIKIEVGYDYSKYFDYDTPPECHTYIDSFLLDLNSDVLLAQYDEHGEIKDIQAYDFDEDKLYDEIYDFVKDELAYRY